MNRKSKKAAEPEVKRNEIIEALELKCCQLKMPAHGIYHFLVFRTIWIRVFLQYLI